MSNRREPRNEAHSFPPDFQSDVSRAHEAAARYEQSGEHHALQEAVAIWTCVLRHAAFSGMDADFRHRAIKRSGNLALQCYREMQNVQDLDDAVTLWEQALVHVPAGSPHHLALLTNLGEALRKRHHYSHALTDLGNAIQFYQQAIEHAPPDASNLSAIRNGLGLALSDRYADTGALADLEQSIEVYEEAIVHAPTDSPDFPVILNNLGNGLSDLYEVTGERSQLDRTIAVYEQAIAIFPTESPQRSIILSNLGKALRDRHAVTGEHRDLDRSIQLHGVLPTSVRSACLTSKISFAKSVVLREECVLP